ncbi:hypothetical protein K2Q00_03070 [Patescibacteria group bacterium]|nr:hypothetical protein [Patescibacteria group bacterium]
MIFSIGLGGSKPSNSTVNAEDAAKQAAELAAWQETPAGKLCAKHTDWKRKACDLILEKKVAIGMSPEQARAAWGEPDHVNRTITADGTNEQWVYGSNYIYFDDGILSSIQN